MINKFSNFFNDDIDRQYKIYKNLIEEIDKEQGKDLDKNLSKVESDKVRISPLNENDIKTLSSNLNKLIKIREELEKIGKEKLNILKKNKLDKLKRLLDKNIKHFKDFNDNYIKYDESVRKINDLFNNIILKLVNKGEKRQALIHLKDKISGLINKGDLFPTLKLQLQEKEKDVQEKINKIDSESPRFKNEKGHLLLLQQNLKEIENKLKELVNDIDPEAEAFIDGKFVPPLGMRISREINSLIAQRDDILNEIFSEKPYQEVSLRKESPVTPIPKTPLSPKKITIKRESEIDPQHLQQYVNEGQKMIDIIIQKVVGKIGKETLEKITKLAAKFKDTILKKLNGLKLRSKIYAEINNQVQKFLNDKLIKKVEKEIQLDLWANKLKKWRESVYKNCNNNQVKSKVLGKILEILYKPKEIDEFVKNAKSGKKNIEQIKEEFISFAVTLFNNVELQMLSGGHELSKQEVRKQEEVINKLFQKDNLFNVDKGWQIGFWGEKLKKWRDKAFNQCQEAYPKGGSTLNSIYKKLYVEINLDELIKKAKLNKNIEQVKMGFIDLAKSIFSTRNVNLPADKQRPLSDAEKEINELFKEDNLFCEYMLHIAKQEIVEEETKKKVDSFVDASRKPLKGRVKKVASPPQEIEDKMIAGLRPVRILRRTKRIAKANNPTKLEGKRSATKVL